MNEAGASAQLPYTKLPNNIAIMAGHADLTGGVRADEETMKAILATLTRDDALFHCARVNTIATGFDAMVSPIGSSIHARYGDWLVPDYDRPDCGCQCLMI
jgi:hypothetical protein